MSTPKGKSVDVGLDISKQLITLASALIPVAIGLVELRYPKDAVPMTVTSMLVWSTIAYLFSIIIGLAVYGGVVATLRKSVDFDVMYKKSVRIPAMIQQFLFLAGLGFMIYGVNIAFS